MEVADADFWDMTKISLKNGNKNSKIISDDLH
jgi:hypothetical protein